MVIQDSQEKRFFNRIRFTEPVQFQLKDPHKFGGCLACDISEGGVKINLNEFLPLGTEVNLNIHLDVEKNIECYAQVVWTKQLPYSERYQIGLKFTRPQSLLEARNDIRKFYSNSKHN
ncbi:MAG: PilZ domain-containing protein [Candidatus Omnitrophica bacterium]|nr:PilZ domain-containing protein [Candidatus Omnitrophota bacterium]MCB9747713.1 PilZ domain-containing protein [Candidatus Omnitrophota bacterium]